MEDLDKVDIEKILGVLKSVAGNYPESSEEYKSIEIAAKALIAVRSENIYRRFKVFLKEIGSELTDKQKKHLRDLGLDEYL
jgi:hypothetical protein